MFTSLGIAATVTAGGVLGMLSPSGRRWIDSLLYDGRHQIAITRAERKWHGPREARVVYTNLDSQRMTYVSLPAQWK